MAENRQRLILGLLALLCISCLLIPLGWCPYSDTPEDVLKELFGKCAVDGVVSQFQCNACSKARITCTACFLLFLTLFGVLMVMDWRRQRGKVSSRHGANDQPASGRNTAGADIEKARDVQLSDWTTYDERITAPPLSYSTEPKSTLVRESTATLHQYLAAAKSTSNKFAHPAFTSWPEL